MEWYYNKGDEIIGPVSKKKITNLIRENTINRDTLVWNEEMEGWTVITEVSEFKNVRTRKQPPPLPKNRPISRLVMTSGEKFYLDSNGVTIKCKNTVPGDKGTVNGVEYECVDDELLMKRIAEGSDVTKLCTSLVSSMSGLFFKSKLNETIEHWDTSNVKSMKNMFSGSFFNQPIGKWDVSSVTDMNSMFANCSFNQPIGKWDVSSVTHMCFMFFNSPFNQPIGDWNVSNVWTMWDMFNGSKFNQPIGNWDVSSVERMNGMFKFSTFNQSIGDWDVSNVTIMREMFQGSLFNEPIRFWNVKNVKSMDKMFQGSDFNQNLTNWCVWRIGNEPIDFSTKSPLTEENKPVWGTCPD